MRKTHLWKGDIFLTNLLLRLFVREDPATPKGRAKTGRLSGIVGIFCNLLLFGGKLAIGTLSGSVSITADAMNNLTDATGSIVTLIGFRLAEKPADEDHPYGHARYEYISGLAVAALILLIGFELAKTSFHKILDPTPVVFSLPLAAVLVLSIAIKLWLSLLNRKLGKLIGSTALEATAADSRNDCLATAAVLVASILETAFSWRVDGWFGMAVALFILWSGVGLARETISPLLGESANPALRQAIIETVTQEPKVLGYHDLMVHDYGPGQRFASMHVEMSKDEDPLVCHDLIDELERLCLQQHNVHLVIHYDPVVTGDPELDRIREFVVTVLREYHPELSIHDFRMVRGIDHTNLIFDIVLPYRLMEEKKAIRRHLNEALAQQEDTTYYTVITFDAAFPQN